MSANESAPAHPRTQKRSRLPGSASRWATRWSHEDATSRPRHLCLKGSFNPALISMEGYAEILWIIYTRETEFFNLMAPKLNNLTLPKVWCADDSVMIMEDLNKKGYIYGEPAESWVYWQGLSRSPRWLPIRGSSAWKTDYPWLTPAYEAITISMTEASWDAMILGADRPPFPRRHQSEQRAHGVGAGEALRDRGPQVPVSASRTATCTLATRTSTVTTGRTSSTGRRRTSGRRACGSPTEEPTPWPSVLDHYRQTLVRLGVPALSRDDPAVMVERRKSAISGMGWILTSY
ncbi:hypothetical protein F4778DRAFT_783578 [Xylariomycetidae sp. FL2044]|nr:hypothetical protein F4778DRAFT_783578 [Xylariomycetidae sp. FL2044]